MILGDRPNCVNIKVTPIAQTIFLVGGTSPQEHHDKIDDGRRKEQYGGAVVKERADARNRAIDDAKVEHPVSK